MTGSLITACLALWLAAGDARVPIAAKIIASVTVAYALSPIDLIPDFIPILGHLDDLLIIPLGIWLAIRLVPPDVWEECKKRASAQPAELPRSRCAAFVIVGIWIVTISAVALWIWKLASGGR